MESGRSRGREGEVLNWQGEVGCRSRLLRGLYLLLSSTVRRAFVCLSALLVLSAAALGGGTAAPLKEKELVRNRQNSRLHVWEELLHMLVSTFCLSEQN